MPLERMKKEIPALFLLTAILLGPSSMGHQKIGNKKLKRERLAIEGKFPVTMEVTKLFNVGAAPSEAVLVAGNPVKGRIGVFIDSFGAPVDGWLVHYEKFAKTGTLSFGREWMVKGLLNKPKTMGVTKDGHYCLITADGSSVKLLPTTKTTLAPHSIPVDTCMRGLSEGVEKSLERFGRDGPWSSVKLTEKMVKKKWLESPEGTLISMVTLDKNKILIACKKQVDIDVHDCLISAFYLIREKGQFLLDKIEMEGEFNNRVWKVSGNRLLLLVNPIFPTNRGNILILLRVF